MLAKPPAYLREMQTGAPVKEGDILAGRYRVERVLASGGMGVVVAATHVGLGQKVALKFLLPAMLGTVDAATRFDREARAAALLKSEHITRIIDVGKLENGAPYMVMEFLEGCDLADLIERDGPLSIETAATYLLQACEGLAEAHAAQIVHRDLKPSNLFRASRPDGSPLIKILDFGISKVADSGQASVTATAAVLGSPLYMSPEQMMSSKNVDARADIWSLGVVLYQLVSGVAPFEEETLPGLFVAISTKEPRRLTERMAAPAELEAVVAKCLEKSPAARYQNVAELATALAPFAPNAREHVERIRRLVLGSANAATPLSSSGSVRVEAGAQAQTDPFGRTKTALAGSTPDLVINPARRSPIPFLVGGVAMVAIIGATVAYVARQSSPSPAAAAAAVIATDQKANPVVPGIRPTSPAEVAVPLSALPAASATPPVATATSAATAKPVTKPATPLPTAAAPSAKPSASTLAPAPSTTTPSGFTRDRK